MPSESLPLTPNPQREQICFPRWERGLQRGQSRGCTVPPGVGHPSSPACCPESGFWLQGLHFQRIHLGLVAIEQGLEVPQNMGEAGGRLPVHREVKLAQASLFQVFRCQPPNATGGGDGAGAGKTGQAQVCSFPCTFICSGSSPARNAVLPLEVHILLPACPHPSHTLAFRASTARTMGSQSLAT